MISRSFSLLLALGSIWIAAVSGFAPIVPASVEVPASATVQAPEIVASSSQLQSGIQSYMNQKPSTGLESSTLSLSLKERPPPPTKEEIAAKQRNFNFWFWGGGFVAPFIATVYYFGPKFWTK